MSSFYKDLSCFASLSLAVLLRHVSSLSLIVGVFIGVLSAVVNTDFVNKFTLFVTTIGMSLPSFFAAILVAWLFGYVWESFTGLSMTGNLYSVEHLTFASHARELHPLVFQSVLSVLGGSCVESSR